jgi:PAS domain S-box-containing protein
MLTADPTAAGSFDLFAGGDEMGERIRSHDWGATSLGQPEGWPRPLKTIVAIMLGSSQAMFVAWGAERILIYNEPYSQILAAKHPHALGQPFLDVWSEIRDDLVPIVDRAFAGGSVQMDDITLTVARRGYLEEAHFAFSYTPIWSEHGQVDGLFCACMETTGQVQAAADLRASEARLELATHAASLGIWDWDVATGRMTYSPRAKEICGFSSDQEVTYADARAVTHPDDYPRTSAMARRALDPAICEREPYEYRILRPDGTVRWVLAHGEAVFAEADGERRAVRYVGTLQDITDRRRAEEERVASEARLRLALEAGGMAVWEADLTTDTVISSPELNRLLGFPEASRPRTEEIRARYYPGERERIRAIGAAAMARGERTIEAEYRYMWPDGSVRWLMLRAEVVTDAAQRPVSAIGVVLDITERKRNEEALRESEARLRASEAQLATVLDEVPVGVGLFDASGQFTIKNPRLRDLVGDLIPSRDEAEGSQWAAYDLAGQPIPPQEYPGARVLRGEDFPPSVDFQRRSEGEDRWLRVSAVPVRGDSGAVTGGITVVQDVTDELRVQRELKQLNASLEQRVAERTAERDRVWRNSRDLLVVIDRRWTLLAVNPAVTTLLGYQSAEVTGRRFSDFVHPEDLRSAARAIRAAAKAPVGDFEARIRARDGAWRCFSWSAAPGEGEAYVSGRDITAEKERQGALAAAEAARREADALYRAYFESTPEALFVIRVNPGGEFVVEEVNPAHEAGIGLKIEDIRGKRIEHILPPAVAAKVLETYRHVVEMGAVLQYREVYDLTGEPQHWDTSIVPVRDAAGRITRLIGSSRNVTRQVVAEEALRQSQKMEAMGQLTGGVAHDFNNLLSPIMGGLDLLERRGVGDERAKRTIAGALASAERAKTLVQRLLAFARRQPLQPTAVDVRAIVEGMAELVSSTTGPQVKVVVEVAGDLPLALADANQIEMALLNLSVNARDAMPDGGTLTISGAEDVVGPGHRSQLGSGRYVLLSVSDTGVGMDEATLSRAIEPFFSTKGVGKGTGLGLSMVHGLAAQLGGALHIGSHPGLGTKVELWLPIGRGAPAETDPVSGAQQRPTSGTVLLVDDEDLVRASTADMLTDMGYTVVEATSAEEALRLLSDGLRPDLLVTDHLMPGMSGTDLARETCKRMPGTPVLIISGYAEVEGMAPDLPRLSKPFRQADLAFSVAELMKSSG